MTNFSLDQYRLYLDKKYNLVDFIDLNEFTQQSALYDQILSCKKDIFLDNERIVFVYSNNKINYLLEVIKHIDIPEFFIILLVPNNISFSYNTGDITVLYLKEFTLTNNKIFDIPNNHCIYPWINAQIDNLGFVTPCCVFKATKKHSLNELSIKENYLSDPYNQIRSNFRNNTQMPECNACWVNEDSGSPSMRTMAKHKLGDLYYKIDLTKDDVNDLQMLDLKLGNNCNLSCRICDEAASSSIAKFKLDHNKLSVQKFNEIKDLSLWAESTAFNDQILEIAPNLRYLDIYGGEPFMNKMHFNFLYKLIELDVAHKICIDYNSNGTFYSKKFFEYWNKFKKVKISFSIDDIGERFEVQRDGGNWDQVVNNIKEFNTHTSTTFMTDIFPTVNIQNVYYLPELIEWAHTQNFNDGMTFNILRMPAELSIHNLPMKVKEEVAKKLSKYPILSPVLNYMFQEPTLTINAVEYLIGLDQNRKKTYAETHKEFAKLLANSFESPV